MLALPCTRSRSLLPNLSHLARTNQPFRQASSASSPVPLAYDKLVPPDGNETEQPLVIIHGLFGSKRNWGSLSKAFLRDLHRPVYCLDLRNHGASPHADIMNYSVMAEDVLRFCQNHSLENVSLLGHSMGGKVAMSLALSPEVPQDLLAHLIVADIAPTRGRLSPEFESYVEAMLKIEAQGVSSRREAQQILKPYEKDPMVRAFLLTNLVESPDGPLRFRIPVHTIGASMGELGAFPYAPGERAWAGDTLFIKGSKSRYISDRALPAARQFFPHMQLETLDAGHWVHAERPNEFLTLVTDFIKNHEH
ncbi:alpha/beta-hydrolase [Amylocystis lapponica]|nr:alpha/beta-hydrolase [Amylocystis lapponica]